MTVAEGLGRTSILGRAGGTQAVFGRQYRCLTAQPATQRQSVSRKHQAATRATRLSSLFFPRTEEQGKRKRAEKQACATAFSTRTL